MQKSTNVSIHRVRTESALTFKRDSDVTASMDGQDNIVKVNQARTQPKIYGGAKPIFQDLYVYIFVLLEFICIIYERIMCEKA